MPTFWNALSVPSSKVGMKMEQTEHSETMVHKIQMRGNQPEESIQQGRSRFSEQKSFHFILQNTVMINTFIMCEHKQQSTSCP